MAKCFIFAIGGSGARVLESFTHLIAAGCAYDQLQGWEFEPIIIDLDTDNGNTVRCIDALQTYEKIHTDLAGTTGESPYFRFPIQRNVGTGNNFLMQLHAPDTNSLSGSIGYATLSDHRDKGLIDLLYKENVLNMSLSMGFKGVPSIGNVVLNQLGSNAIYQSFLKQFMPGDRIVVIGSIFGGTGAAGLPILLKNFRASGMASVSNAPIAAISVMPYFQIESDNNSMINSDSFITKTKAALSYYERNLTEANSMYYVGYNSTQQFENHEGGGKQDNDPMAIEVIAATSIFHFLSQDSDSFQPFSNPDLYPNSRKFYTCGFRANNGVIDLSSLEGEMNRWLKFPLSSFYYSSLMGYYTEIRFNTTKGANDVSITNIKFPINFGTSEFIRNFFKYQQLFMTWLHKLSQSSGNPRFIPFETVNNLSEVDGWEQTKQLPYLIKGLPITKKTGFGPFAKLPTSIREEFSHFKDTKGSVRKIAANNPQLFSEVSYLCAKTFISEYQHLT